jgi:hypothetical protein
LRFQRLDANSGAAVERLIRSFIAFITGCRCEKFNPPCPTCSDARVVLAEITIEDCEVVDVCGLVRQWVLTPRILKYWLPIDHLLRSILLPRCCAKYGDVNTRMDTTSSPKQQQTEAEILQHEAYRAATLLRPPADAPEFDELLHLADELIVPQTVDTGREPTVAATPTATDVPAPATDPEYSSRLESMEQELNELRDLVAKLTAGQQP